MPDDASPGEFASADAVAPRAASKPARPVVRRLVLVGAGVAALAAAGLYGLNWWTTGRFVQSTNDAYFRADQVVVAPKVQGYVTEVLVADNQPVKAGQPLVRIDARSYTASLAQAQATVDARQADVAAAEAQAQQQLATVDQAQAQLASARTGAAFAAGEVERYRPLVASGADTAERLQQLISTRDQNRQTAAADAAALAAAQRQVVTLKAQIGQAQAQLEAARANADQVRLNLQDTVVVSSTDGKVGDRAVRVGQYVAPGARLMTIVPVQALYLVANFKETQIGRMRPGQPVRIRVDALPGADVHGVVDSFAPGTGAEFALLPPENATGNFTKIVQRVPVRIRVLAGPEARRVLTPGLSATVAVDTRGAGQ
jgi:membrane fusion protein, multidrug efflux system